MARGQQKIQAQQKNAAKQAKMKKGAGSDQKAAAKKALIYTCPVCRTQMPDPKTYKQHFESKHPKQPLPPELQGAGVWSVTTDTPLTKIMSFLLSVIVYNITSV